MASYRDRGWVSRLPVYGPHEVIANRRGFEQLVRGLPAGADAYAINAWHLTSRIVYDLCTHPRILDYVEDLIGPDLLLWGSHFFCKEAGDQRTVAWHQDARYWPLAPHRTATVWLAIDDSDVGNGAMRVLSGTHGDGILPHRDGVDAASVLGAAVDPAAIGDLALDDARADAIELRAGEISLHDDNLIHGSPANASSRRRCGLTMRFMPPEVRCDPAVWPNFSAILVRGQDRCGNIRLAPPPTGETSEPVIGRHPY
jgi:ectoine hydroxylase-related dioxygenase (phytanoyl-CoA dioxygenase family)